MLPFVWSINLRDRRPELTLKLVAVKGVSAGSRFVKPIGVGVCKRVKLGTPFFYGVGAPNMKQKIEI